MIVITAGDPCGIGPEVTLKALHALRSRPALPVTVIGDAEVFARTMAATRRRLPSWVRFCSVDNRRTAFRPGRSSAAAGAASLAYLDRAMEWWRAGQVHALVTAPVTKWAIAKTQPDFVGHTEYLAKATRTRAVVMMFVSDDLRVAVLTRHIPLRSVSAAITRRLLHEALELTAEGLRSRFGIRHPRLAMCGLNPHAGEGRPASEERRVIEPVLRLLRRRGIRCDGPFAADGFFASARNYDAVICAYHDQGLIPFKMAARDRGCQMTVGLPILRTSPDHGSALDIAGRGIADPGSMEYALRLALRLARSC